RNATTGVDSPYARPGTDVEYSFSVGWDGCKVQFSTQADLGQLMHDVEAVGLFLI
ncbi:MAG: hypothetical protein Q9198_010893, partial [Flavoplaca austrocitrina]